jgi:hypothetical protein
MTSGQGIIQPVTMFSLSPVHSSSRHMLGLLAGRVNIDERCERRGPA